MCFSHVKYKSFLERKYNSIINFSNQIIKDNIFTILDEEGPLANLRLNDFKNRCSNKVLALCNYYFTWGNADKRLIIKKTNIKTLELIPIDKLKKYALDIS